MKYVFWAVISVISALVVHIAYVLFVPIMAFNAGMDEALGGQKTNQFALLTAQQQRHLMPFADGNDLVLLCKYDVSQGPVRLSMHVPQGYWSMVVYTIRGHQVYALNDKQADAQEFTVILQKAKSWVEQLSPGGDDVDVTSDAVGWTVDVAEPEGMAFLWMPRVNTWSREEARVELEKSRCRSAADQ